MRRKKYAIGMLVFLMVLQLLSLSTAIVAAAEAPKEGAAQEAQKEGAAKEEAAPAFEAPKLKPGDYPQTSWFNSREAVWVASQVHLFFGAFVLAVPLFVLVIEGIGVSTKDERYDHMSHEIMKVTMTAFSLTALSGGVLTIFLLIFYPDFFKYLIRLFQPTVIIYAFAFLGEAIFTYTYYYSWDALRYGTKKWIHLTLGLLLNTFGLTILFIADAWTSFMMSPVGINADGARTAESIWELIHNPLWNALNLHRFIANLAYGGAIVGAYAAYKFISSEREEDKAHYDWMGYTSNFIAISALLPLPFAGYILMAEVYAYSQQMGITAMGGIMAWLFIVQAVLIGAVFLGANYYLWCGMGKISGAERYTPYIKLIAAVIIGAFLVWLTPHTIVMTGKEMKIIGGSHSPLLGPLGIMPAKNTAANTMILFTFLSFFLYRRGNKGLTVPWAGTGTTFMSAFFAVAWLNIIACGLYGYLVPTAFKVRSSVPQVLSTLSVIVVLLIVDGLMQKNSKSLGPIKWGKMAPRSQYALFLLAISFTWLMALMGYIRSGIRQHWHVYTIMRDASPDAFTPTIGHAVIVATEATVIFMGLVIFCFWIAHISTMKQAPVPGIAGASESHGRKH